MCVCGVCVCVLVNEYMCVCVIVSVHMSNYRVRMFLLISLQTNYCVVTSYVFCINARVEELSEKQLMLFLYSVHFQYISIV